MIFHTVLRKVCHFDTVLGLFVVIPFPLSLPFSSSFSQDLFYISSLFLPFSFFPFVLFPLYSLITLSYYIVIGSLLYILIIIVFIYYICFTIYSFFLSFFYRLLYSVIVIYNLPLPLCSLSLEEIYFIYRIF